MLMVFRLTMILVGMFFVVELYVWFLFLRVYEDFFFISVLVVGVVRWF